VKLSRGLFMPALTMAAVLCLSPSAQCSGDLSEHAIDPVVMIGGNLGGTATFGAGIIFARDKDRLYAVTANHVVRSAGMAASSLTVRLRTAPSKNLPAHLLAQFDAALDLAVLSIDNLAAQGINVCSLSLDRLQEPGTAKRGDSVYPVGNPNGIPWSLPVRPDALSDVSEDNISFQSSLIARGHSGGGLINTDGQLVGMIQADEPPYGRAIDMHKILQVLESWKYPTDLNVHVEGADPPLIVATETGQIEEVKRLLRQACADPNAESKEFGYRAIELAGRKGSLEIVEQLVDAGADLKAKGHDPSIVYSAAIGGNAEVVRLLLSRGAPCCGSSLISAAQEGYVEIVKILLESGANPNGLSGGRTAFFYTLVGSMHAGKHTDKEAVLRTLIQAGANVNLPNFDDETPLLTAVETQETSSVKLLLAAGAKIDARGRGGRSVWDIVTARSGSNDHEIAAFLAGSALAVDPEGGSKLLDRAATEGWTDVVDLLIKHGVNVKGMAGASPLMNATMGGRVEVVQLLLQAGTNPDARPPSQPNVTPLQSIVHANDGWGLSDLANDPAVRLEIVKLLISKGANVRTGQTDLYNGDPLYLTLFEIGDLDVAEILVVHGANVNRENRDGYSYLHYARKIANQKVANFLLKHGGRDITNPAYPH
jgi:ankyrin repeat protein